MNLKEFFNGLRTFDLDELNDMERMGVWPPAIKTILGIIVLAACFGATYYFMVKPKMEALDRVINEESDLKKQYETKAFQVANLDAYREQLEGMRLTFGALLRQLPNETRIPALLDDVNNMAKQSGIDVDNISIGSPAKQSLFIEQPFTIIARGEYHELGNFVSGLSGLPRIVTLHDFRLTKDNSGEGDAPLRVEFSAKTYQYLDSQ